MPCFGAVLTGWRSRRAQVICKVDPLEGKGFALTGNIKGVVNEVRSVLPHAFSSQNLPVPSGRISIQLEPIDLPKRHSMLYLPIAISLLLKMPDMVIDNEVERISSETQAVNVDDITAAEEAHKKAKLLLEWAERIRAIAERDYFCFGSVNIEGNVRGVNGALSLLDRIRDGDIAIIPEENIREAQFWQKTTEIKNVEIYTVSSLLEAAEIITSLEKAKPIRTRVLPKFRNKFKGAPDMSQIVGQKQAKRALEVAAAGGHHCLLYGPQGEGKSLLAKALAGILPSLDPTTNMKEIQEINRLWSARGELDDGELILSRPFRDISAGITEAALLGGGRPEPQPGEISLAHRGVLLMDELPQFPRPLVEKLRVPLQDGRIRVSRMSGTFDFPAEFILIAAMNPCRCSYYGEYQCIRCSKILTQEEHRCSCGAKELKHRCTCGYAIRRRFEELLSGPLEDRIHLKIRVYSSESAFTFKGDGEKSRTIRSRVHKARKLQAKRYKNQSISLNSEISLPNQIEEYFRLSKGAHTLIKALHRLLPYHFSTRARVQTLCVARTIADLQESEELKAAPIAEAALYYTRPLLAAIEERRQLPDTVKAFLAKARLSEED